MSRSASSEGYEQSATSQWQRLAEQIEIVQSKTPGINSAAKVEAAASEAEGVASNRFAETGFKSGMHKAAIRTADIAVTITSKFANDVATSNSQSRMQGGRAV